MGITDNIRNPYDFQYVQDQLEHIEDFIEQDNTELDNMAIKTSLGKTRKMKKSNLYKCLLDHSIRAKKKGARQARRVENTQYLLCQSEQDDPDLAETEYVDLMDHGLTPFAALFVEQEKMQIWNDFINQSEDDQRDLLKQVRGHDIDLDDGQDNEGHSSDESWEDVGDCRNVHPAYSVEECFQKIDQRLKSMLKRRHLALGTLIDLEEDLIPFFIEWPHSVYVCQLQNSFERMLLHALCQYLHLHSSSFDDDSGGRHTQVENFGRNFNVPSMTLSHYIEYQENKH